MRSPGVYCGLLLSFLLGWLPGCALLPPPSARVEPPPAAVPEPRPAPPKEPAPGLPQVDDPRLDPLDQAARQEIDKGRLPGAVILVGHQGKIVYFKAFGLRAVQPRPQAMTKDTVFDLASLTKVIATTTAIMQLVDRGALGLDDPVARYFSEFAAHDKAHITVRQLLTHTSGLRAEVNSRVRWSGQYGALLAVCADRPVHPPGGAFRYSDANFVVLGELVRRISGLSLDIYCTRLIFRPLGLRHTSFRPPADQQSRLAPSESHHGGGPSAQVQDPTARRMGGVAGNAGLFSTADDLAVFAQMLLDGGTSRKHRILSAQAVAAMTKPQRLPGGAGQRGLGWDMVSPYSKEHNAAFPRGSFGHTGYTGTSIWIDPASKTFLIILANRLHPDGQGQVKGLRTKVAAAVAAAVPMGRPAAAAGLGSAGQNAAGAGHGQGDYYEQVRPGIEVLAAGGFAPLQGKTIGVITNHTGRDAAGRSTLRRLLNAPGVKVGAIFTPEHGLAGTLDEKILSGRDPATGLPVYSLYGKVKRPTPEMLAGLDALVYDIQDVGVRFYTYITTLAYSMEAAAAAGLDFYVLDRPNPLTGTVVQGCMLESALKSFIGYFSLPVRYGMTVGELARLFNAENRIRARLHVVRMTDYRREMWWDETGLAWVNPSPNLRSLTQTILYPGVALVEAANVSVGRGTETPFEVVGAPWIEGDGLARYLKGRAIAGVAFEPAVFVPRANRYRGERCQGVRLRLTDRSALDGPALGIELAAALYHLYPKKFEIDRTLHMVGSRQTLQAVKLGQDPKDLTRTWQPGLDGFRALRQKYLLY